MRRNLEFLKKKINYILPNYILPQHAQHAHGMSGLLATDSESTIMVFDENVDIHLYRRFWERGSKTFFGLGGVLPVIVFEVGKLFIFNLIV